MKKNLYYTFLLLIGASTYCSAQNWSLTGNAGTAPATNFLGTTDAKPLVLRTNNKERLRITTDGKIGIGTKNTNCLFSPVWYHAN